MKRFWWLAVATLCLASCGNNTPFVPVGNVGYGPVMQAPPPPNYSVPTQPPYIGGQPGGGYFVPQAPMPPGMPPQQFYPFLPIYQYFQGTPGLQQYWGQFWAGWMQYAQTQAMSPYNFNAFWYNYCPMQWSSAQFMPIYQYFDQNFYYWVTPQTQWSYGVDVSTFWDNCSYYPYPSYGSCGGGC